MSDISYIIEKRDEVKDRIDTLISSNNITQKEKIVSQLMKDAESFGYPKGSCDYFAIRLSFEEGYVNAWKHGNKEDANKRIFIHYIITQDNVRIVIKDQGNGFAQDKRSDCRQGENLYKPSGRGIFLMESYMTSLAYSQGGKKLIMIKNKTK